MMNELQKELQDLKEKVDALEARIVAEPVKWEPKGGDWLIDKNGDVQDDAFFTPDSRLFGVQRSTKEQAERAAVEMRRFNRLLALRDELCGDDVVDWRNEDQDKWCLYFDNTIEVWSYACRHNLQYITPYFTTKELAQKACDMLNSGEVEL